MNEKESICLNCIYGSQPYGYYPIVCVYDAEHIREMWYDKHHCRRCELCPEPPKQKPWQVIITKK